MAHIHEFHPVLQHCIMQQVTNIFDHTDWREWRDCFQAGRPFRDNYLEKFTTKENKTDFERRRKMTPIPSYARKEISAVKNSLSQRLPDIKRRGGSKEWQRIVDGEGRGVDLRGSSMNGYIVKDLLTDLLVMGKVGVLVDAPRIQRASGEEVISRADIPVGFQPFLSRFSVEAMPIMIEAPNESPSDWQSVLLETRQSGYDLRTGQSTCTSTFRYYWLEDEEASRIGKVNIIFLDQDGNFISDTIKTNLNVIPFVVFDIGLSLMADVCSYQIALLNMISADSSYAIDSNYSFLTRQRGNDAGTAGTHLKGGKGDETARTGSQRGLFYNKNEDRPQFISPPTAPMKASLELRRELKDEIRELVTGAIRDLGEDGSIEAGLAYIGTCIEHSEQRCWDHWTSFEESRPEERKKIIPTIGYPDSWSLKTDKERVEEADSLLDLSAKIVGRAAKKEAAAMAVDRLYRGKVDPREIEKMIREIREAPYSTSDPKIIIAAKKEGIFSVETSALALGAEAGEGERALDDAAQRAKLVVAAQSDVNQAGRGNEDGQAGENSERLAREGETQGAANLREPGNPGRPNNGENTE